MNSFFSTSSNGHPFLTGLASHTLVDLELALPRPGMIHFLAFSDTSAVTEVDPVLRRSCIRRWRRPRASRSLSDRLREVVLAPHGAQLDAPACGVGDHQIVWYGEPAYHGRADLNKQAYLFAGFKGSRITNATRRFWARPFRVPLSAIGWVSP